MPMYYLIEASYGPRVEQSSLRSGVIDAETPEDAIKKARTEFDSYGHERIEVFGIEEDYRARKPPLAMWENTASLEMLVRNERVRKKFEAFFVNPLPK